MNYQEIEKSKQVFDEVKIYAIDKCLCFLKEIVITSKSMFSQDGFFCYQNLYTAVLPKEWHKLNLIELTDTLRNNAIKIDGLSKPVQFIQFDFELMFDNTVDIKTIQAINIKGDTDYVYDKNEPLCCNTDVLFGITRVADIYRSQLGRGFIIDKQKSNQ